MKLVIDIPEESYNFRVKLLKYALETGNYDDLTLIDKAIATSTPLPKGHGRLIDADAYVDKREVSGWLEDIYVDEFNAITPTIIEADKDGDKE